MDTLEGQLELLRKQVVRSKSVSQRSIANHTIKTDSNTQDAETQTEDYLANSGPSSMTGTNQTTKQSRCVIS